jgi:hypothetical protein
VDIHGKRPVERNHPRCFTLVSRLAELLDVPAGRVLVVGFWQLGLLLTLHESVPLKSASRIAAEFGYRARRQGA